MSAAGRHVLILLATVSADDYPKILRIGIPLEDPSIWSTGLERFAGVHLLLAESGLDVLPSTEMVELEVAAPGNVATVEDYFRHFCSNLHANIGRVISGKDTASIVLVLDLLPFYLNPTRLDKLVPSLRLSGGLPPGTRVVFLLRNIDSLTRSTEFETLLSARRLATETFACDIRSYGLRFAPDGQSYSFQLSRAPFLRLLKTDDRTIYHSLIYRTNSYIGHFILRHAHARTHYDLTEFVKYDNVWEYLHDRFVRQLGNKQRVQILGVGMEFGAVYRMGEQFKTVLPEQIREFRFAGDREPTEIIGPNWSTTFDHIVILSDIVITGATVKPWIDVIHEFGGVGRISIFAVARMQNSPETVSSVPVESGVVIKRDYYSRDEKKCRLCLIGQPKSKVRSIEEFRRVAPGQLTPYDFWEMVTEARALKRQETDAQGRSLIYRIDTKELLRRYGSWLKNVVRVKFKKNIPNMRPDAVVGVNEPSGQRFVAVVAAALNVQKTIVVDRSNLDRVTANTGLPVGMTDPFGASHSILIADDGINYGETIHRLVAFCRAAGVTPIGAIVLDSRLSPSRVKRLTNSMAGRPLIALYEWPSVTGEL